MVQKKNQYRRDSLRKIYSKPNYKVYKSYKVPTQKYKVAPVYRSSTNTTIAAIIRDLLAGKLVTGQDFSFSLTYDEFKVNGEVQSQEVLEKFRSKYLKDPANHFIYSKNGGTTKTDVYVR